MLGRRRGGRACGDGTKSSGEAEERRDGRQYNNANSIIHQGPTKSAKAPPSTDSAGTPRYTGFMNSNRMPTRSDSDGHYDLPSSSSSECISNGLGKRSYSIGGCAASCTFLYVCLLALSCFRHAHAIYMQACEPACEPACNLFYLIILWAWPSSVSACKQACVRAINYNRGSCGSDIRPPA